MNTNKIGIIWTFISMYSISVSAAPTAPVLSVDNTGRRVNLEWSEVDGADGYIFHFAPLPYDEKSSLTSLNLGKRNELRGNLPLNSAYYAVISAYDDEGESETSNPVEVVIDNLRTLKIDDTLNENGIYEFNDFSEPFVNPSSITKYNAKTIQVGQFISGEDLPSTNDYSICDFGFFETSIFGTNNGNTRNAEEIALPGVWGVLAEAVEADLNNDSFSDLIVIDFIIGSPINRPKSNLYAFLNDGNGNLRLAPDLFEDGEFPCIKDDDFDYPNDPNNPCGYYSGVLRQPIVADFNNDGIDDFIWSSLLFLSDDGVLKNVSHSNLPDIFFDETAIGPVFTHDINTGDVDNDGDIDVFIPMKGVTRSGYRLDGTTFDDCDICNEQLERMMLINDGNGKFAANFNIPTVPRDTSTNPWNELWSTSAVIGDFNNDGYGDIAVGWARPADAADFGYATNSSGLVYLNDGKNNWSTISEIELPSNYYGELGIVNDMETIDYNDDGYLDIVIGNTRQPPFYYFGRAIQIFRNDNGQSFTDVTDELIDNSKYEFGPEGGILSPAGEPVGWWNGEGRLKIVDFDGDGDKDIIDSVYKTYVQINDNGIFNLYENYPRIGGKYDNSVDETAWSALYPINLNDDGMYDFVGYIMNQSSDGKSNSATFFQLISR